MLPAPPAVPQKSRSKPHPAQNSASPRPAPQTYFDTLPSSMQRPDPAAEVTYAVEILNRNARGAGLSNRVHVPAVPTLPPPSDLAAKLTGDGVTLTWTGTAEAQNLAANSTGPSLQHRYRIYRREQSSGKDAIAGEVPLGPPGTANFTDGTLEWEKTYLYRITAVNIIKRADSELQIEGDDTPPVRVVAHDIFPPSVPSGLQAAYSGEGQKPFIDLIWAPVSNADLAGYNVYRSNGKGTSGEQPVKLNSDLVKPPSYRDNAVSAGNIYTYFVSAVDVRGNESPRSEPTSESIP